MVSRVAGKIRVSDRIAAIVDIVRQAAAATEGAEVSHHRAIPHGSALGNLVIEVRIPYYLPSIVDGARLARLPDQACPDRSRSCHSRLWRAGR